MIAKATLLWYRVRSPRWGEKEGLARILLQCPEERLASERNRRTLPYLLLRRDFPVRKRMGGVGIFREGESPDVGLGELLFLEVVRLAAIVALS